MRSQARADRSSVVDLLPLVLAMALLGVLAGLWATWPEPRAQPAPGPEVPALAPVAPTMVAAAGGVLAAGARARDDVTPPPAAPLRSFVQMVDDMVQLGIATAAAATADDIAAAKAADAEARATFLDLMTRFPDAGERGLQLLAEQPEQTTDLAITGRVVVLQLVLDEELARRRVAASGGGERASLDLLVQSVLDTMPVGVRAGEVGDRALHERPYLRGVHEPTVLQLVRLAGEAKFPRAIATHMLLTLWANLQQFGERSSDEISRLALLLLADSDPSQRLAACRQLLTDPRYRALVVGWLREHADQAVASELAALAARELEPAQALQVLRELSPVLQQAPNAYLVLGFRAPEALADAYQELLASNTQPGVRRDLVTGVGMSGSAQGLEIAQLALAHDPSPDVRIQAVFAITARGQVELAERAVNQLLDEPLIAQDPSRLGSLVLTLQNLEAGGHTNEIDRLAQRLRTLPLAEHSQQLLDALVQRSLPGGRTTVPGWSR